MRTRSCVYIALILLIAFAACASGLKEDPAPAGTGVIAQAATLKALSLSIASPVRAGRPYPALMTCTLPSAGADIL
ncbi:MAG TPA: hypothetical protein PKY31_15605, partial [Spirochaetota bacterium]|nr:hypothetical protein [Spirochaetota bacterium]